MLWPDLSWNRIQCSRPFIRALLEFEEEDEEEVRGEFEGLEQLEMAEEDEDREDKLQPGRRVQRGHRFSSHECGVSKRGRNEDDDCCLPTVQLISITIARSCSHNTHPLQHIIFCRMHAQTLSFILLLELSPIKLLAHSYKIALGLGIFIILQLHQSLI